MEAPRTVVVLELLEGIQPFAERELARLGDAVEILDASPTELRVAVADVGDTLALRTVVAAYLSVDLDVPRPRAILSPEHLARLRQAAEEAGAAARPARFSTFRISAAGQGSDDFVRIRDAFATATDLRWDEEGEMLLRFRRRGRGWEVLVRLTPRPLSARPWRVARYEAGLNATIAAAMVDATEPAPDDDFADLMCGSGTIVIERLARGPARRLVACDVDPRAIELTKESQRAAKYRGRVELVVADAREVLQRGDVHSKLCVNLPWGMRSGSHDENDTLYPDVLRLARAAVRHDGRFVVLTQDVRRFERALREVNGWDVAGSWRILQKGHRPALYLLTPGGR